ncbi:MAG TPA: histidine kinase, partial [Dehalococcoidia bacterium]|nr:histidine kinase [Dehalococcoidia bacterium]
MDRVEERLGALRDLEVLEARSEPELDGLASLAALACGTSMAAISFLDGEREWFKATVGFEAASLPMSQSLTRDLVAGSGDALIVSGEAIADRWPVHPLL